MKNLLIFASLAFLFACNPDTPDPINQTPKDFIEGKAYVQYHSYHNAIRDVNLSDSTRYGKFTFNETSFLREVLDVTRTDTNLVSTITKPLVWLNDETFETDLYGDTWTITVTSIAQDSIITYIEQTDDTYPWYKQ